MISQNYSGKYAYKISNNKISEKLYLDEKEEIQSKEIYVYDDKGRISENKNYNSKVFAYKQKREYDSSQHDIYKQRCDCKHRSNCCWRLGFFDKFKVSRPDHRVYCFFIGSTRCYQDPKAC